MKRVRLILLLSLCIPITPGAQSAFDAEQNKWSLNNGSISVAFRLTPSGHFLNEGIWDLSTGDRWEPSNDAPSAPIRLETGSEVYDAQTQYVLWKHSTQTLTPPGTRQTIVLRDLSNTAEFTLVLDLYDGESVLHYGLTYRNLKASRVYVNSVNLLPWSFAASGRRFTALRINQWSADSELLDFEPIQMPVDPQGTPVEVLSGARQEHCGWLALHDESLRGLFAGWEFDGRSRSTVRYTSSAGALELSSAILDLHHPVDPSAEFQVPSAFLGVFHGDFDEAGYRTQRFVESVLAKPAPDKQNFPYVSWDSWGYEDQIDEETLRRNAQIAAGLGVELFVVDLGWARSIGDWRPDPAKFPNGLGPLSAYVHSLGMKFGVHFAFAEAEANSPVLQANPDWTSSQNDDYHGALSLCPSHQPVKEWLIQEGIRLIDESGADWILQDGENMVKRCTKSSHSHDPSDSNYSNSVDGLNAVIHGIQSARPKVNWENCENGGNMMTFNMVRNYVTSITNDASGSFQSRRAVFGATYPFPPRYAERYMPEGDGLDPYATHSYRFGGPWVLMNRLVDLDADQKGFLTQQIAKYKADRSQIARGKVYHILPPAVLGNDVIQSYNAETDSAIAVVTRDQSAAPEFRFRPRGLNPRQRYTIWSDIDPSVYSMPGEQLMTTGVRVRLPAPFSSDVVHVDPQ